NNFHTTPFPEPLTEGLNPTGDFSLATAEHVDGSLARGILIKNNSTQTGRLISGPDTVRFDIYESIEKITPPVYPPHF
ncbi:MAG: hypothetical protein ABI743_07730, partial [bacterium]